MADNNHSSGSHQFSMKIKGLFDSAARELKRTKDIGVKMLNAGQLSSDLNTCYQELGREVFEAIQKGKISNDVTNHSSDYVEKISRLQAQLEDCEAEVGNIKSQDSE